MDREMALAFRVATEADVSALLKLRLAVDADQARSFGKDRWVTRITEQSVTRGLTASRVLLATGQGQLLGALRMATKKPWAIDLQYFTPVPMALYLHDVNVDPSVQRRGVGRQLIEHAKIVAREWPASAIRLDAYDGPGGGGAFYTKCGFAEVGHTVYRNVPLVYFELLLPDDGRSRSG
jgi:GNAT superfamily N-acetyltransferase